jgi:hypothetical protein
MRCTPYANARKHAPSKECGGRLPDSQIDFSAFAPSLNAQAAFGQAVTIEDIFLKFSGRFAG